jgi:hypothetical protein
MGHPASTVRTSKRGFHTPLHPSCRMTAPRSVRGLPRRPATFNGAMVCERIAPLTPPTRLQRNSNANPTGAFTYVLFRFLCLHRSRNSTNGLEGWAKTIAPKRCHPSRLTSAPTVPARRLPIYRRLRWSCLAHGKSAPQWCASALSRIGPFKINQMRTVRAWALCPLVTKGPNSRRTPVSRRCDAKGYRLN